jgi:xanthine/CO dehydrogenase XdhC/CoxF family maturation factor
MEEVERELARALELGQPVALARVRRGPGRGRWLLVWPAGHVRGDLGGGRLNQRVALYAEALLAKDPRPSEKSFEVKGEKVVVEFEFHRPPE